MDRVSVRFNGFPDAVLVDVGSVEDAIGSMSRTDYCVSIDQAFMWATTPEGDLYWRSESERVENGGRPSEEALAKLREYLRLASEAMSKSLRAIASNSDDPCEI